jgi:type IV secretion system protein VirB4
VTKIYLPNADAATSAQAPLYRDLGLNEREIAIVAQAAPKRHYYLKSPRGSRLFELGLGPVALSFIAAEPGASMEDTRRHLEALIAAHGRDWPAARLTERGLGDWADRLPTSHTQEGGSPDDTLLALPIAR